MKRIFNICNFYIFIWLLYFFHWKTPGMFPIFDVLSNVFLAIGLGLSLYYFFVANFNYTLPRFYKIMNVLLCMFTIYGVLSIVSGEVIYVSQYTKLNNGSYLIGPLRTFLPFYVFFVFSKKGLLTETRMKIWAVIMFVQTLFCFIQVFFSKGVEAGEVVNGVAYSFVMLLPYLFLIKKSNVISYALLFVFLYIILLGLKRGAILTGVLFAVYFILIKMKDSSLGGKVGVLILLIVAVFAGGIVVSDLYSNNIQLQNRVEATMEGNTSGRDYIAKSIWNVYSTSGFGRLLFGYGADGSVKTVGIYAHNDWLEMLINTGIIGLFVYVAFWYSMFSEWRRSKHDIWIRNVLGGLIIVMFPRSVFSMYYSHIEISAGMLFAYCMVLSQNKTMREIIQSKK